MCCWSVVHSFPTLALRWYLSTYDAEETKAQDRTGHARRNMANVNLIILSKQMTMKEKQNSHIISGQGTELCNMETTE